MVICFLLYIIVEVRQHRTSTGELDSRKAQAAQLAQTNLSRSRSAQSLKQQHDQQTHEDKLTILSQLFWIAISLLESDYDHEFSLAVRLLDKVCHRNIFRVIFYLHVWFSIILVTTWLETNYGLFYYESEIKWWQKSNKTSSNHFRLKSLFWPSTMLLRND